MGSGRDLYNACCAFEGQPYSTAPGRTDPNSGHKDCSGLVAAGFEVVQGHELGAYVSVTIFEQSVNAGLEIPFWMAQHIVGALIYKPENPYLGWGANGHIAVSDGSGGTIEATPPRVQRLPLSYNAPWSSRASLAIEIDYANNGNGAPGAPLPDQESTLMWAVYYGNIDGSVTFIHGIGAVVAFRLIGQPVAPYGLPMRELDYIGFSFAGVTTKLVTPGVGDNLEKASAKLLA